MRLCTVFHSRDAVTDMLDREGEVLRDALERLGGRTEWGVKVLADLGAARAAFEREAGEETGDAGVSEGRGYLAARPREREAGDALDDRLRTAVRDVHETLAAEAEAALRNPVQHRDLSGHEGEMLLNGVYLVDDARALGFLARVDTLAERHARLGLTLERTGPWPPYNFVAPAQEP
jgi:Gas vesicle synthesis protein GvpL/GvpF